MLHRFFVFLQRMFTTVYSPQMDSREFLERAETQEDEIAGITVAIPSAKESKQLFGTSTARHSIQPVFIRIANRHSQPLRLYMLEIDPHYYTPLEAAGICHFSSLKRLSAFGIVAWYFLPLLLLAPLKLFTAWQANKRMDDCFRSSSFPLRPIPPGETVEGFVYTTLDAGSKTVRICLYSTGGSNTEDGPTELQGLTMKASAPVVDRTFVIPVAGISTDYLRHNFDEFYSPTEYVTCDLAELATRLHNMPPATTNSKGKRQGDPVNLVVIGEFATLLSAFTCRWDESETITLATCWKTVKAFLLGVEYRYSPVSALHLFGRGQDIALQRIRRSINERLHLRLWLTPLRFGNESVWVGQISRDIGVRFTTQAWNLTTHRVDPNVDESRDYLVEDLLRAQRVKAVGYVDGVGECEPEAPRHNLTGDPYYTDGKRAVIVLSPDRTDPVHVSWK